MQQAQPNSFPSVCQDEDDGWKLQPLCYPFRPSFDPRWWWARPRHFQAAWYIFWWEAAKSPRSSLQLKRQKRGLHLEGIPSQQRRPKKRAKKDANPKETKETKEKPDETEDANEEPGPKRRKSLNKDADRRWRNDLWRCRIDSEVPAALWRVCRTWTLRALPMRCPWSSGWRPVGARALVLTTLENCWFFQTFTASLLH